MRRSGRVPWTEVRVGVIILFAFAVLLWAAFRGTGMSVFETTYPLHAYFKDVSGLMSGSPVWLGGIEVGYVSGIALTDERGAGCIRVDFKVRENAWPLISSNSTAAVSTMGLMGDKYLSVSVRQPGDPPAVQGEEIAADVSGDLTTAFADTPDLMANLTVTTNRLNAILERVERGEGFLGRITTDSRSSDAVDSLVTSSRRLMVQLSDSQRRLVRSIERASASFDSLAGGVLRGDGTLSRLVWDTTLYTSLSGVAGRANSLLENWDSGGGTIGRLGSDSAMYVEVRDLVTDVRGLVDDITANPRKYFKFSVF
ncbi:MAG TPA: MlaD family protein [Acidobacteriota bacterium]|nr:MlaD family protein [Acidobacteriota bacterium]